MHTFKIFLATSTAALLAAAPGVRAADTPQQSELRQLLRKQIAQPPTQAAPPVVAPAPQPKPAPVPQPAPAPVVRPAPAVQPAPAPVTVAPVADSSTDYNALRRALREGTGKPMAETPAATPPSQAAFTETPSAATPAAWSGQPAFKPLPGPAAIAAPPLPISAAKEKRLADLLRLYKANVVTPEQYHAQRVAILAEP